jgi:SAM-dependent methyltransferase
MPGYRSFREHEEASRRDLGNTRTGPWSENGIYDLVRKARLLVQRAFRTALIPRYHALLPRRGKILVMGAGMGEERELMRGVADDSRVVYSDLSRAALDKVPGNSRKVVASSCTLDPFEDGEFSAVVSMDHMDIFPPEYMETVLRSAHRVLKPNGLFLSAHSSIPAVNMWSLDPVRMVQITRPGNTARTAADEQELSAVKERYRNSIKYHMIGGRPPLFVDMKHEMVAGTHFGEWEPRHEDRALSHGHMVPKGDIPMYTNFFGSVGASGLTESMNPLRQVKHSLGPEGAHIVIPDPAELRRKFKKPVGELFMHDSIHGRKV